MHECEGKKTTLLQAEAGAFGLGLANVLFCAGGVVFLNAPVRRKVRGEKIETPCRKFLKAIIQSKLSFICIHCQVSGKVSKSGVWLAPN